MNDFEVTKKSLLAPLLLEAGAALMDCQAFEFGMGLLLYHFSRLGADGLNPKTLRAVLENDEKKTAGQLVSMFRKHLKASEGLEEALYEALTARNRLIHRIFIDNVERLPMEKERTELIKEIRQLRGTVQRADRAMKPFIEGLSKALDGVDAEKVREEAKVMFLNGP